MNKPKFIEVLIDNQLRSISDGNIALIKQINADITEIHLFSKRNNEQIRFQVAYNYMNFKALIEDENRFGINFTLNEFK